MDFTALELALLSLVGIVAGFLNVMAGGGSLLTVPVMVFMGVPGPVANGSNRIAILAQNISATVAFFRKGYSDFRLSLSLAACALPGAVAGAFVGAQLSGEWFNRTLAIIMVGVMVIMALDKGPKPVDQDYVTPSRQRLLWGHILMVGAGFYGGFIQLGVGFILIPILHRVMGFDLVRTNMHKVFIIATYTSAALLVFASQVEILWIVGLALALGNSIGGWIAANVQVQQGEGIIKLVLNGILAAFIVKLLFFY
jgi:uncharacterized membrane protein YfcA